MENSAATKRGANVRCIIISHLKTNLLFLLATKEMRSDTSQEWVWKDKFILLTQFLHSQKTNLNKLYLYMVRTEKEKRTS